MKFLPTSRSLRGFTLIELMIAMTITLFLTLALVTIFLNISRSQREFKKFNDLVDNGRFAINAISSQLAHAGYWGGFVPQFDNLVLKTAPLDSPSAVPDPCKAYANWTTQDRVNLIGIPMQTFTAMPSGTGCVGQISAKSGSDAVVIRGLERCLPGVGNCEADTVGRLYMQVATCPAELRAGTAISADSTRIVLGANASNVNGAYVGMMLRTTGGVGAGQIRWVSAYDGSTRRATVSPTWAIVPDSTTTYAFDYTLGQTSYPLHTRTCTGTGTPPTLPITAGPLASKRRYLSDLYYIHEYDHPERAGEKVPALVRSRFDVNGGTLAQQAPTPLVDGVEAMRVQLGVDDVSDAGLPVDLTAAIDWADPNDYQSPKNRGDGSPDRYVRCTTASPCSAATLTHVVAAKIYVLIRARDTTIEHTDNKTYCLGEPDVDGECPADSLIGPFGDHYVRHVFSRTVRLPNISGRRETP